METGVHILPRSRSVDIMVSITDGISKLPYLSPCFSHYRIFQDQVKHCTGERENWGRAVRPPERKTGTPDSF